MRDRKREREREREREAETQAEGEAGSMQGAQRGTRSRVSRIIPWAEGGAKPLSHPGCPHQDFLWFCSNLLQQETANTQGKVVIKDMVIATI